jgi:hypothetical protein
MARLNEALFVYLGLTTPVREKGTQ